MWTTRRIFLALVGLLAFAGGYFGYSRVLGTFDGLPPLPAQYQEGVPPPPVTDLPSVRVSTMDQKFQQAFGVNCAEISYPIKTELKGRRTLVAARDFKIIKSGDRTGWVQLLSL